MLEFFGLNLLSVILAYVLDVQFGEPNTPYHPVRLLGLLISKLEKTLYKNPSKFYGGILLIILTLLAVYYTVYIILSLSLLGGEFAYFIVNTVIIYFCISIRSMTDHAEAVIKPLDEGDIEGAKNSLSMIVSRDVQNMNSGSIVRSGVESVSENFTDGVLSPMFYAMLLGGLGAAMFKAVSTLDSMVGYMNEKYELFGRPSAKADDALNFIPARLSVVVIAIAGYIKGVPLAKTFGVAKKYRLAHPSPNSAHSMSAFAGVLDVKLGGPVSYFGQVKQKPYIGEGGAELNTTVLKRAVVLYRLSALVAVTMLGVLPLIFVVLACL